MANAFGINPELMILTNTSPSKSEAGFSYRLDSGKDDFNRVIASNNLQTLNFLDISVDGFDKYLYFDDLNQLASFVSTIKTSNDAADPTPYLKEKMGKDVVIAVYGKVSITLADSANPAAPIELCRPVYAVPRSKRGELHAIQDVRQDISQTWIEECKEALFYSGSDAVKRFGVVKRLKDSDQLQLKLLKWFLGVALLVITILGVGAVFNSQIGASASNGISTQPSQGAIANTLMNANFQQPAVATAHPADSVYGGGFTGQEGHNTVDDFARLQVAQTQSMLKEMGVDVTASKQNLGCFAGGAS